MKYALLSILFFLLFFADSCTDEDPKPFKQQVNLEVQHYWGDSVMVLNHTYFRKEPSYTDTITPTKLIYHINHLTLFTEDSLRIDAKHDYYMFNSEENGMLPEPISFTTPLEGVKYYVCAMEFTIGVADSATSASNLLGSRFISPMYWGMIQGYINFKFEAVTPGPGTIIYHIGGYLKPYKNSRRVRVNFDKPYLLNRENALNLKVDLLKLFSSKNILDLKTVHHVEVPNDNSVLIADNIAEMFRFNGMK